MENQVYELIKEFAATVGQTTETVFGYMVRLCFIDSIIGVVGGIIALLASGIIVKLSVPRYNKWDCDGNPLCVFVPIGIIILIPLGIIMVLVSMGGVFVPEAQAVKEILQILK